MPLRRLRRDVGGGGDAHAALVNGALEFGDALGDDAAGALDSARADSEQRGGIVRRCLISPPIGGLIRLPITAAIALKELISQAVGDEG